MMSYIFSAVHKVPINLSPPDKIVTPYGGRLTWNLPGQNKLVVHLKDKDKIRHKKRWSQVYITVSLLWLGVSYFQWRCPDANLALYFQTKKHVILFYKPGPSWS